LTRILACWYVIDSIQGDSVDRRVVPTSLVAVGVGPALAFAQALDSVAPGANATRRRAWIETRDDVVVAQHLRNARVFKDVVG
jgi:hypothetical protein